MPPKFYKKKIKYVSTVPDNVYTSKYLIIVESPSKCPKIESYLGINYCCIASRGHIRGINGLRAIDTKNTFEPTFNELDEKKEHISTMKKIISQFSYENIILATDDDREGEAIAWHICDLFNLPLDKTKRIIFHEVTKKGLINGINNPTLINLQLVKAQQARQILDIIVGYKISPILWKYLYNNNNNSLSAGRCQSPALRLIYDNNIMKQSKDNIETYYKTIGLFFDKSIKFELNVEFTRKEDVITHMNKSIKFDHTLSINKSKNSIRTPPKPFHTSRLLQVANNILHISPSETMKLCQQLYQTGYITYMRTESTKYAKTFLNEITKYIQNEYKNDKYIGNIEELENKDTNNPHEAIRVTQLTNKTISSEDNRLVSMYKLIWKNTIESCMSSAEYNCIPIEILGPEETKYKYTLEIPLFLGWKIITEKKLDTELQNTSNGLLMYFKTQLNKPIKYNSIESTVFVKNKHSHYTEASLINKLEDIGIGRPSTFSTIVTTILDRGYVNKTNIDGMKVNCIDYILNDNNISENKEERIFGNEKNKLVIQPIGILTIEFLMKYYNELFSYEYTKNMEDKLDIITNNDNDWSNICRECYNDIKNMTKSIKIEKQTYPLDDKHVLLFEKYGPVIQYVNDKNEYEYISVKKDFPIDLEKLKNKEYTLDELIEIKEHVVGTYKNNNVVIKNGRYGKYLECGDTRESLKNLEKDITEIKMEDILNILEKTNEKSEDVNLLRIINDNISIRKGKFGIYVFYKTSQMKKPKFLNIKKFKEGPLTCDANILLNWLHDTYDIEIS
tara:strand:- start:2684 stop:5056 length:2373 start_codon:yes stop_codon:yes gene_type:complete